MTVEFEIGMLGYKSSHGLYNDLSTNIRMTTPINGGN